MARRQLELRPELRAFRRSTLLAADGSDERDRGSRRFGAQGLAVAARFRGGFDAVLMAENRRVKEKARRFLRRRIARKRSERATVPAFFCVFLKIPACFEKFSRNFLLGGPLNIAENGALR